MGVVDFQDLVKRYTNNSYYCNSYYDDCGNSAWYTWGRWIVLVAIVVAVLLAFFLFSCLTARRRRRRGAQPFYGTGWLAGQTPPGHNPPNYYANQQATPQYEQQGYSGENAGYYAPQGGYYGQQQGVELQSPPNAYTAPQGGYAPPPGPPPAKA